MNKFVFNQKLADFIKVESIRAKDGECLLL